MNRNGISTQILQVIDGVLVCLAFWLTAALRDPFRVLIGQGAIGGEPMADLSLVLMVSILIIPLTLEAIGFYTHIGGLPRSVKLAFSGVIISCVILAILMVVTRAPVQSRFIFLGFPPLLILFITIRAWVVASYHRHRSTFDARKEAVQLFGSEEEVEEFVKNLSQEDQQNWDIQDSLDLNSTKINEIVDVLQHRSIATVIFISDKAEFSRLSRAVEVCESMGIETMVATDFLRTRISIPEIAQVGGRAMITLRSTPSVSYSLVLKKLLDRIGSFFLILATLPFWVFSIIGIKITSPKGPVFFKQKRAGLYGRPFTMWKFRTMHPDAESQRDQIIAEHGNQMDGPVFKLDDDPRVFKFGNLLRKTSIDELPQLINVLTGEMSLVGPRPLPLVEVEGFQRSEHRRRLSVKPGITCYWQAGGRNSITNFDEWVDLDLKYIDNWSFLLDLKILLMTVPAVLFKKGAK